MPKRIFAVMSIVALLSGCWDDTHLLEPTPAPPPPAAPAPLPDHADLSSYSASIFSIFPGGEVARLPKVRVWFARDNKPVPGTRVTFAFSDGTTTSVLTDDKGFARIDAWPMDFSKPSASVVVTAEGLADVLTYTAFILHKNIVSVYDLQSMGGKSPPFWIPEGGSPPDSIEITGGRYVLFDDGTYVRGLGINGKLEYGLTARFYRLGSAIEFSVDLADTSTFRNLLATARLDGDIMDVTYSDTIDFEDEVYRVNR